MDIITYPVLPNPPAPLTLSSSSSTTCISGVYIYAESQQSLRATIFHSALVHPFDHQLRNTIALLDCRPTKSAFLLIDYSDNGVPSKSDSAWLNSSTLLSDSQISFIEPPKPRDRSVNFELPKPIAKLFPMLKRHLLHLPPIITIDHPRPRINEILNRQPRPRRNPPI